MNISLINIQGITVMATSITDSTTGITTMVTEITLDKITITMEYVCSNGEDPIMLNYEQTWKINHNLPQDGTITLGTFNLKLTTQLKLTAGSIGTSTGSTKFINPRKFWLKIHLFISTVINQSYFSFFSLCLL